MSQLPRGRDEALSTLDAAIGDLNLTEKTADATPAKAAFDSASVLLTLIRDSMISRGDCIELGIACANVCKALNLVMDGRQEVDLSRPVMQAIERLTIVVAEIQRKILKLGKRNSVCRFVHAKSDKRRIAAWKLNLDGILEVFETELATRTQGALPDTPRDWDATTITSGVRRNVLRNSGDADGQNRAAYASAPDDYSPPLRRSTQGTDSDVRSDIVRSRDIVKVQRSVADTRDMISEIHNVVVASSKEGKIYKDGLTQGGIPGESPPPQPRVFYGRDELIEEIVGLAKALTPVALIGPGGIGKTSIALTVLHSNSVKQRFGANRRFIRCDQFPASLTNFLRRLSEAIGANVKNPDSLAPLHSFLSSREMIIVLDNAESILDPRRPSAQEIYEAVEELSRFSNICLCITSRISTIPPDCKTIEIPTLRIDPARDTFYRIYQRGERSDSVDGILKRLDFHPLSITLLATVAHHNKWDTDRLLKEWEERRTSVLETEHNKSLAATIELSLASPMFQELGPDARGLLGVIAFFPQGVDENNLGWLFPTVSGGAAIFDKFCILSLTHRNGGFITMLAPLRDYLSPKDPMSSPFLRTTKERYFARMSVNLDNPNVPGFEDARWIEAEDLNVEHLLDVSTSMDANSDDVWVACADFMRHIFWRKKRLIVLRPNIEALPDDHRHKPECLFELSQVYSSVGDYATRKQLLIQASKIWREREDGYRMVQMSIFLAYTNRQLALYDEGISKAKEAAEICERLDITPMQGHTLRCLAWLLRDGNQLDAAEAAATRAIEIHKARGDQFGICQTYRILAIVCHQKGHVEEAIRHFETALGMATASDWHRELFWGYYCLAEVFFDEGRFDDAHAHAELAKSHSAGHKFHLGRGMQLQATFLYKRQKLEEAKSEVLEAIEVFEDIGTTSDLDKCRDLFRDIQKELNEPATSRNPEGGDRTRKSLKVRHLTSAIP